MHVCFFSANYSNHRPVLAPGYFYTRARNLVVCLHCSCPQLHLITLRFSNMYTPSPCFPGLRDCSGYGLQLREGWRSPLLLLHIVLGILMIGVYVRTRLRIPLTLSLSLHEVGSLNSVPANPGRYSHCLGNRRIFRLKFRPIATIVHISLQ